MRKESVESYFDSIMREKVRSLIEMMELQYDNDFLRQYVEIKLRLGNLSAKEIRLIYKRMRNNNKRPRGI